MNKSEPKTASVAFLPYRMNEEDILIFLQKRTADAPTFPGCFLTFGGSVELGEDPKTALLRELQEELGYSPVRAVYLGSVAFPGHEEHTSLNA